MCCDTVNRGVAYADGKIFLHQADTTLVALDAKTGKEVWKVVNGDPRRARPAPTRRSRRRTRSLSASPAPNSACRAMSPPTNRRRQARVARLHHRSGRADPVRPGEDDSLGKPVGKDSSLKTWNGDQWKIGGGSAWGWFSWDPEARTSSTTAPPIPRPGTRRSAPGPTASRSTRSGRCRSSPATRHRRCRLGLSDDAFDEWDYDGINEMILATTSRWRARSARCSCTSTATASAIRSTA